MDKMKVICVVVFMVFYIIKYAMSMKSSFDANAGCAGAIGVSIYYAVGAYLLYVGGFLDCILAK